MAAPLLFDDATLAVLHRPPSNLVGEVDGLLASSAPGNVERWRELVTTAAATCTPRERVEILLRAVRYFGSRATNDADGTDMRKLSIVLDGVTGKHAFLLMLETMRNVIGMEEEWNPRPVVEWRIGVPSAVIVGAYLRSGGDVAAIRFNARATSFRRDVLGVVETERLNVTRHWSTSGRPHRDTARLWDAMVDRQVETERRLVAASTRILAHRTGPHIARQIETYAAYGRPYAHGSAAAAAPTMSARPPAAAVAAAAAAAPSPSDPRMEVDYQQPRRLLGVAAPIRAPVRAPVNAPTRPHPVTAAAAVNPDATESDEFDSDETESDVDDDTVPKNPKKKKRRRMQSRMRH